MAQFDEQGLWAYRDIRFSKWGNLPETIVGQIELSPSGMTVRELQERLHIGNVKPTLTHLIRQGRVLRARIAGTTVYFLAEPFATPTATPTAGNGGRRETAGPALAGSPTGDCPVGGDDPPSPADASPMGATAGTQADPPDNGGDSGGAGPLPTFGKKRALEFLKVRAQLLSNWSGPLPPAGRLPRHYWLEVASERTFCDACDGKLRRQRSWTRYPVGGMLGEPRVRDVQKQCILCGKVHYSESYHQLVPRQGNYAFDLIVQVGLARFREHRQNGEIQQQIQAHWGLSLPSSTINELAHTFLDYLAALHQARSPQLRKRLEEDGGYVLHVDGTCEPGTDTVFNAVAGHRGWSLAGAR